MKYGSISAGSKEAVDSAKFLLESGGNAFDAAVGAVFTSMVSEFSLTGAGGGGIMLGMDKGQNPFIYDFFVDCPKLTNKNVDFKKVSVNFGDTTQSFQVGKGSVAVPGNIAGLLDIHSKKGVLPLDIILEPTINISNQGIILSKYQAYINSLIEPILLLSKEGNKLFKPNNQFLDEGDRFKNSNFSNFLIQLSKEGKDFFYKGELAQLICDNFGEEGFLTKDSLKQYQPYQRNPITYNINEYTIITNPAPSYAGTLMIFLLKLLQDSNQLNCDIIKLIKAMEITSLARNEVCNNPLNEMEIKQVLDKSIYDKYYSNFMDENFKSNNNSLSGFGSTTHISVMDKDSNIASITTTNGEGCGYFVPEYGIMMNNMLGEQDLNPYGYHKWKTIRRLPTMICPTIILKDDKPLYVLGSGGSNRIRSAITQVILNLIIKNMPLEEAINAPRIHLEGNDLFLEPGINLDNKYKHLNVNPFKEKSLFFGGVNCVSPNEAIGDFRRGGIGLVI